MADLEKERSLLNSKLSSLQNDKKTTEAKLKARIASISKEKENADITFKEKKTMWLWKVRL